eukprot:gnl/Chilomastix_cuspidata/667.p2 GENE.gnl/Chilomastix_cuspidata/667~~gnl/Chilomastix_cuspidata/667.p2  ORF type:complete len:690 (+),score=254.75 gnl/Chilomastix_cuspidata/667:65-2071(+)
MPPPKPSRQSFPGPHKKTRIEGGALLNEVQNSNAEEFFQNSIQDELAKVTNEVDNARQILDLERAQKKRNEEIIQDYKLKINDLYLDAGLDEQEVERQQHYHERIQRIQNSIFRVREELKKSEAENTRSGEQASQLSKDIRLNKAQLSKIDFQTRKLTKETDDLRQILRQTTEEREKALAESKELVERFAQEKTHWMSEIRQYKVSSMPIGFNGGVNPSLGAGALGGLVPPRGASSVANANPNAPSSAAVSASRASPPSSTSGQPRRMSDEAFQTLRSVAKSDAPPPLGPLPAIPVRGGAKMTLAEMPPPQHNLLPLQIGEEKEDEENSEDDEKKLSVQLYNSLRATITGAADVNSGLLNFVNQLTKEHQALQEKVELARRTIGRLKSNAALDSSSGRKAGRLIEEEVARLQEQISQKNVFFKDLVTTSVGAYNHTARIANTIYKARPVDTHLLTNKSAGFMTVRSMPLMYTRTAANFARKSAFDDQGGELAFPLFLSTPEAPFPPKEQFVDLLGSIEGSVLDMVSRLAKAADQVFVQKMGSTFLQAAIHNSHIEPAHVAFTDRAGGESHKLFQVTSLRGNAHALESSDSAEASSSESLDQQEAQFGFEAKNRLQKFFSVRSATMEQIKKSLKINPDAAESIGKTFEVLSVTKKILDDEIKSLSGAQG